MPVGRVVHDEVHHDPDAPAAGLVQELDEVAGGAVAWIDAVVVGDVVAVVPVRRRLERPEPERRHPEALEVVEAVAQALEVAAAVTVAVLERLQVEAVDDRVAIPEIGEHLFACTATGRLRTTAAVTLYDPTTLMPHPVPHRLIEPPTPPRGAA